MKWTCQCGCLASHALTAAVLWVAPNPPGGLPNPASGNGSNTSGNATDGPGYEAGVRPALRHHGRHRPDRTTRCRHPLPPTTAARFDGDPSGRVLPTYKPDGLTDRDGATLWRIHMTPTDIGAVFRSRIRTGRPSHPSPQAYLGRGTPVRHRLPTRAGVPHPPACGRPPRWLGSPPPGPGKAATYHGHLPT